MSEAFGFHPVPVSHSQTGWQARVSSQQTDRGGWGVTPGRMCLSLEEADILPEPAQRPAFLWAEPSNWSCREIWAPFNPSCSWELFVPLSVQRWPWALCQGTPHRRDPTPSVLGCGRGLP